MTETKLILSLSKRAVLIWLGTNLFGSLFFPLSWATLRSSHLGGYWPEILLIGLVLSLPVMLLMIPNLYILFMLPYRMLRVLYAPVSVFILCFGLLRFVGFGSEPIFDIGSIRLFSPYILAAITMVFIFARRIIFSADGHGSIETVSSESREI